MSDAAVIPGLGAARTVRAATRARRALAIAGIIGAIVSLAWVASSYPGRFAGAYPVAGGADGARAAFPAVLFATQALLFAAAGLLWLRRLARRLPIPGTIVALAASLGVVAATVTRGQGPALEVAAAVQDGPLAVASAVLGRRGALDLLALGAAVAISALLLGRWMGSRPGPREGIVLGLAVGLGALVAETGLLAAAFVSAEAAAAAAGGRALSYGWVVGAPLLGARWGLAGFGVDAVAAALAGVALAVARSPGAVRPRIAAAAGLAVLAALTLVAWDAVGCAIALALRLAAGDVSALIPAIDFSLAGIAIAFVGGPGMAVLAHVWRHRAAGGRASDAAGESRVRPWSWPVPALAAAAIALVWLDGGTRAVVLGWTSIVDGLAQEDIARAFPTAALAALVLSAPALLIAGLGARRTGVPGRALAVGVLAMAIATLVAVGLPGALLGRVLDPGVRAVSLTPLVEETAKLLVIAAVLGLLVRARGTRAGIVVGIAVGIGFNVIETAGYVQSAAAGLPAMAAATLALRVANGGFGLHVASAALLGAGLGAAGVTGRSLSPGSGARPIVMVGLAFAGAVLTHVAMNALSDGMLAGMLGSFDPSDPASAAGPVKAYLAGTAVTWVIAGPALAATAVAWWRGRLPDPGSQGASVTPADPAQPGGSVSPSDPEDGPRQLAAPSLPFDTPP